MSLEQPRKIPSQRSQSGNSLQAGAELVTVSWSLFFSGMMNGVGSPSSRNSPSPIPRPRGIKGAFSRGSSTPWMIPEEPREEQGLRCLHRPRGPGVLWMTSCGHSWRKSSGWQAGRRKNLGISPLDLLPTPPCAWMGPSSSTNRNPERLGSTPLSSRGSGMLFPSLATFPSPFLAPAVRRCPDIPNSRIPGVPGRQRCLIKR